MTPLFKKLNFKNQSQIVVLNAPDSFGAEMAAMRDFTDVHMDLAAAQSAVFVMAFCVRQDEVDAYATAVAARMTGDGVLWMVYPKGSSKRYRCEFNRDTGWAVLGALGFEPVRMVAVDEDWSALRFRRVEHIKTMTRSADLALTEEGKRRVDF